MYQNILEIQRLSKGYLFSLSEGLFISAGNLDCPSRAYGAYHEYVMPLLLREKQWEEIKAAQADQRTVAVYKNKDEYKKNRSAYMKRYKLKLFHHQVPLPFGKEPT